uniref:myeloid differentiation primary response protein MyD88-like n=1 Tax=Styela clava TaxID=7725 RepID=UPI001939A4FD|nr:myeloid differentiation primary response protein MyD88-like [Styela clava]XP_039270206.1 myeloid differentiation primary response protein MyD88-like [Styela clava]
MNRPRIPCESASCDSTTSEFNYPTASGISSMTPSSHYATEHSDRDLEKPDLGLGSLAPSTFNPNEKAGDMESNFGDLADKKGPDSSFPPPQDVGGRPPSYSTIGDNNVQNYGHAAPRFFTPQQGAMDKLSTISDLPVTILGSVTLYEMSIRLDPELLPSQNWKMMAEYMQFNNWEIKMFEREALRTKAVIEAWSRMGAHTIGELISIIHRDMNRLDVITDIPDFILNDAKRHHNSARRSYGPDSYGIMPPPPSRSESETSFTSIQSTMTGVTACDLGIYSEKPTAQNSSRPVQVPEIQPSIQQKKYDAFVLCNIADKEFVVERFLPKVEDEAKLNLCFAERDIPPGNLTFTDQMDYMFSRSRKLVVILSDKFFQSREHEWQSNLAISQDPASRKQRIIPIKYKKINNRNIFDHLGCCDLTKTMKEQWFWDKIINGIKA